MEFKIPYGLDSATGRLVHIDSVPNGVACGCECPSCEAPLTAKNGGKIRKHHFAHSVHNSACEGWLHATSKLALYDRIQDALNNGESIPISWQCDICRCHHNGDLLRNADGVRLEKFISGFDFRIKPDLTILAGSNPHSYLEIVHSHKPEATTHKHAQANSRPLLVFDVKSPDDVEALLSEPLSPDTFYIPCYCRVCPNCKTNRLCPGVNYRYCEQCQDCIHIYEDKSHYHCPDCGVLLYEGWEEPRYFRCFCCSNARRFKLPPCKNRDKEHRHCKDCGQAIVRKNRWGEIFEYCYECHAQQKTQTRTETSCRSADPFAQGIASTINGLAGEQGTPPSQTDPVKYSHDEESASREAERKKWEQFSEWFRRQQA